MKAITATFAFAIIALLFGCGVLVRADTSTADYDEQIAVCMPEKQLPDLQAALSSAMNQAPRIISGLLELEQARTGVKQALAPMLPNASLSANYGKSHNRYDYESYMVKDSNGAPVLDGSGNPEWTTATTANAMVQDLSYNAGISQPIYHWGALRKGYQSAQLQRAIATRNVEEVRRALAIEIRRAYFSLIGAAAGLEDEKVTLARLEEELSFMQKQAADGFVTSSQVGEFEARVGDFKIQMQRSKNNFDNQWRAFCDLVGYDRSTPPFVFPKEIPAVPPVIQSILPKLTTELGSYTPNNLLNAEDSIRMEKLNYEIIETRLRPNLNFSVNANRGYHAPDTAAYFGGPYINTSYGMGFSVNWSVFDGFSTQSAEKSSRIHLRQRERERDQMRQDYRDALQNNIMNLSLSWHSLERSENGLRDTRTHAEVVQKDYEAGMVKKQDWESVQRDVNSSVQTANNVRADYYLQLATYLSLRGRDPAAGFTTKK